MPPRKRKVGDIGTGTGTGTGTSIGTAGSRHQVHSLFPHLHAPDRVLELLQRGARVEEVDADGLTPLHRAAGMGSVASVEHLLAFGADLNCKKRRSRDVYSIPGMGHAPDEFTALYIACLSGKAAVVRKLLDKGASIDDKAQDGTTSLLAATRGGHAAVVNILLEAGADPNAAGASAAYRTMGTTSALHQASADGSTDIAMALLDAGADIHFNQVHLAWMPWRTGSGASSCDFPSSSSSLYRRRDGTPQDSGIGTALHLACGYDHAGTALALIARGASVHALDGDKMTPLCVATHRLSVDTIKALIQKGNAPVGPSPRPLPPSLVIVSPSHPAPHPPPPAPRPLPLAPHPVSLAPCPACRRAAQGAQQRALGGRAARLR